MRRFFQAVQPVYALVVFGGWALGPFFLAGTVAGPAGWTWAAATLLIALVHQLAVRRLAPDLSRRRSDVGPGTPTWDLAWNLAFWPLMASGPLLAGWAAHAGSPPLAWPLAGAGVLVLAAGFAMSGWAMVSNPFFEGTVRLQTERQQVAVDRGPYAYVRHPGYVGLALWALAQPLLLRSVEALGPAVLVVAWLALRTVKEDAFLRRGLPGYADYAARVRARWVPGVF